MCTMKPRSPGVPNYGGKEIHVPNPPAPEKGENKKRLRGGIESGLLVAMMPEFDLARTAVLGAAGRLLSGAPGGAIDLMSPKILRLHRTMQASGQG